MLTPDYLFHVSDNVVEMYEKLNSFAVNDICRRLVNTDWQFTGSIDWQLYKLQQSGMLLDDIVQKVSRITKKSENEIASIFKEATYKSHKYDNSVYQKAGLTPISIDQSPQMLKILQATYLQTMGELRNFTKSTASVGQRIFMDTMDDVYFRVISGQQSYTEAVRQAINTVSVEGIGIFYPTGHKDTIETAVRRCIVTGVSQATAKVSIQNATEMGTDLVLVSAHLGARPSHAEWQGKVYSLTGSSKKYPKLSEATGYGSVVGLCGANCRHHFMPFLEGISSNPYEDFGNTKNQKYYEKQQEQRKRERGIRTSKRELQALRECIDRTKDNKIRFSLQQDYDRKAAQLKRKNHAYKEFCSENQLKTQQERISVSGWDRTSAAQAKAGAARYKDSMSIKEYRVVNREGEPASYAQQKGVKEVLLDMPVKAKSTLNDIIIQVNSNLGSGYDEKNNTIHLASNASKREIFHELGHAFEGRIFNQTELDKIKKSITHGFTKDDIIIKTAKDSNNIEHDIFLLKNEKLINEYQGRLYIDSISEAINQDGTININCMGEFVSVAVEYYFMFPKTMKKWYPQMYKLVKGALQ